MNWTTPMHPDHQLAKLERLRKLSDLWDRSLGIPGTRIKVGLESLVGLLPVGGDIIPIEFYLCKWHLSLVNSGISPKKYHC